MNTSPRVAAFARRGESCRPRPRGRAPKVLLRVAGLLLLFLGSPLVARSQTSPDTTQAHARVAALAGPQQTAETNPWRSTSLTSWHSRRRPPGTPLPFAGNERPRSYPEISVGIGPGEYVSSFRGAAEAFRALEDSVRRAGYAISPAAGFRSGSVFVVTVGVSVNPRAGISFQLVQTNEADDDVLLAGAFVWRSLLLSRRESFSLGGGLGGGVFRFRFTRRYGVIVSPIDSGGGYTQLDDVRFEGQGAYGTLAGRAALRAGPRLRLEGTVQYLAMGDVSDEITGLGRQSINVSGALLHLSIGVTF